MLQLHGCAVRSWRFTDAESLARYANNREIWRNLRDGFPHPYLLDDAMAFIAMASARVLEKAGYTLEGRMRKSVIKDGTVVDQLLYAYVVD